MNKRYGFEITTRGAKSTFSNYYHMTDKRGRAVYCPCNRAYSLACVLRRSGINAGIPGVRRRRFIPWRKMDILRFNVLWTI